MTASASAGTLLVPVANPETVDRLLDTAIDIARERSMPIVAMHVVEVPAQIPLSDGDRIVTDESEQVLEYATARGTEAGVDVETTLRFARDTATGIVGGVDEHDAEALLMGWRGRPRRRDIILGSFLDHVFAKAPCDVYVKRIRRQSGPPESILVPVAGGPHDELAVELAGTIASQHDASVVLLHVTATEPDDRGYEALLRTRRDVLPERLAVEERIVTNEHVAGAITDETADHDLTILGATEDSFLKRRLVGSVAQGVGRSAESPVIVTRRHLTEK